MKKILVFVLALLIFCLFTVPAFAEGGDAPAGSCCFWCDLIHCCDGGCDCTGFCLCCYWWCFVLAGILLLLIILLVSLRARKNVSREKLLSREEKYMKDPAADASAVVKRSKASDTVVVNCDTHTSYSIRFPKK